MGEQVCPSPVDNRRIGTMETITCTTRDTAFTVEIIRRHLLDQITFPI
jgi:hypothetical protein